MALGQFGTLITQTTSTTYAFASSEDYGMNTILRTLGKASFKGQLMPSKQTEAPLENTAEDGHVRVLS